MSSCSREKIALVVFGGLIILSLFGLGWYLLAGHSWNVAASNIDDTFGNMEGYTAIVYPGTEKPEELPEVEGTDLGRERQVEIPDALDEGIGAAQGGEKESVAGSLADTLSSKPVLTVEEAATSYDAKDATVFELDTLNLEQYRECTILMKGDPRFGVFSVSEPTSQIMLEKQIAYLERHEVDFLVVITPDKSYVDMVSGIDIVICTEDEDLFVMGETIGATFYVDTPKEGRIGAILISPSNVVSAKVIEEL